MTTRMSGRRAAARLALVAVVAVGVAAVGTGRALQPAGKGNGKEPSQAAPRNPVVASLQDEYDLLVVQAELKQTAADGAARQLKMAESQMKRLESAGPGIGPAELAAQRATVAAAKADAALRTGELAEHTVRIRITKRRLDDAIANPPTPGGPTATEESLAKLVQLLAERNAAEKEWMAKEADRQAKEAEQRKALQKAEAARREKELTAREEELKEARKQAAQAAARAKEAEAAAREEVKRRTDAELDRQRLEKVSVLKRLPGEISDAELRIRALELKRDQAQFELEAFHREIDRAKAAKSQLDELKATLEKELKAKNDK